jgi:hypothetical protein
MNPVRRICVAIAIEERLNTFCKIFFFVREGVGVLPKSLLDGILQKSFQLLVEMRVYSYDSYCMDEMSKFMN